MIIEYDGREYEYDPAAIDVKTAIAVKEYTGYGMLSWERAIDDADPKALQALLWAVKRQNGEHVPLKTLEFSPHSFFHAVIEASTRELAARLEEATREAEGVDDADPTVTADAG